MIGVKGTSCLTSADGHQQDESLAPLASHPLAAGAEAEFDRAVDIFISKTHVVNRRVSVCLVYRLPTSTGGEPPPEDVLRVTSARLAVASASAADAARCATVLALCGRGDDARQLLVRKLVARQSDVSAEYDLVVKDRASVSFLPLQDNSRLIPGFAYRLQLGSGGVRLLAPPSADASPSADWLRTHVLPKIAGWTAQAVTGSASVDADQSLQLVHPEQYNTLYKRLKDKYGAEFVKIWPENTDPLKFVYEDVAIAAYLLILWEEDRQRLAIKNKQSFVDIGCGNGLLVHILCSEGHPGFGVDIRSRAIWKIYPASTRLEVDTIRPSVETRYPDCDWLIGNHSDELTPWVPVMAAASGSHTSFFLLPCCPWNFYSKYQRCDTRMSQYQEYMQYVFELAGRCGFVVERDRLRIPSTRRRCVVGRRRWAVVSADALRQLTACRTGDTFRPRPAAPSVRNCSQLAADFRQAAVSRVALRLVDSGELTLPAVAQLLGPETLARLKQQCGGLKTLLRNHAHVFAVAAGSVRMQTAEWLSVDSCGARVDASVKTTLCWQHRYLPAGCVLSADQCRYAHGVGDLRTRPAA